MRIQSILIAAALLVPLAAQQSPLKLDIPGLAAKADAVNDVSLDGAVLKMGLAFIEKSDYGNDHPVNRRDRDLLSRLKGIYVKSYEFHHNNNPVTPADLAPLRDQLTHSGFSRIVSARSKRDNESDEVYLHTGDDGNILGLVVISLQSDELDLVNIVGRIEPADLVSLGGHLGIPGIEINSKAGH
ncbi:MAG TPA: DUF4252 domain-containing protein [Terriglobales bacterium]|nr:DUF4252 domain-containing protein [Terriglobales bacterium]